MFWFSFVQHCAVCCEPDDKASSSRNGPLDIGGRQVNLDGCPLSIPLTSSSFNHDIIIITVRNGPLDGVAYLGRMIMMGATEATSPFPSPVTLNPLPVGFVALLYFCCLDSWFCCLALVLLPC